MESDQDRRDKSERRNNFAVAEFSLIDSEGSLVTNERRKKKDRRTGIEATQTTMSEKEFAEYFRKMNEAGIY